MENQWPFLTVPLWTKVNFVNINNKTCQYQYSWPYMFFLYKYVYASKWPPSLATFGPVGEDSNILCRCLKIMSHAKSKFQGFCLLKRRVLYYFWCSLDKSIPVLTLINIKYISTVATNIYDKVSKCRLRLQTKNDTEIPQVLFTIFRISTRVLL